MCPLFNTAYPSTSEAAASTGATMKAAAKTCLLLDLSHDEVSIVTHELCDPLQPLLAVHLSSTAKGLREAMEEQLAELKQQTQGPGGGAALSRRCGRCCCAFTYYSRTTSVQLKIRSASASSPPLGQRIAAQQHYAALP